MLLSIAIVLVQVIAVLVALYHVVPLGWIAALLRLMQNINLYLLGASTFSVNVRGVKICYLIRNSRTSSTTSRPTAVFVHGAGSSKYTFYSVWKRLPRSWTLIALDLPGHGGSTISTELSYTHVEMEGFLHELFQKLGLAKFHLIGQSMGSVYCSHYASRHPDMVQSVTMVCPPGLHRIGGQCTEFMAVIDDREKLEDTSFPHPMFPTSQKEALKSYNSCFYRPTRIPLRVLDAVVMMRMKQYPNYRKVMLDLHSLATDKSVREMVDDVHVPLQVIWGREDEICHVSGADVIKKMKKDARIRVIDHCGHVVSDECPAVYSRHLVEFVESVTSGELTN